MIADPLSEGEGGGKGMPYSLMRIIVQIDPHLIIPPFNLKRACKRLRGGTCRVKEHCIQRGYSWGDCLAKAASAEGEYYEDLLDYYKQNYRVNCSNMCTENALVEICFGISRLNKVSLTRMT